MQEQLPSTLPSGVLWQSFVPLRGLLARASTLVHHGGMGTTAEPCVRGIPQVRAALIIRPTPSASTRAPLSNWSWAKGTTRGRDSCVGSGQSVVMMTDQAWDVPFIFGVAPINLYPETLMKRQSGGFTPSDAPPQTDE